MKKTAAVLALIGIVTTLASCGGEESPNATVGGFLDASKGGDREAMMEYVEQSDREFLENLNSQGQQAKKYQPPPGLSFTIGEIKVEGDTATVSVTGSKDGEDQTQQLKLVKQDGEWKIDLIPDEMKKIMEDMGKRVKDMGDAMKKIEGAANE